MRQLRQYAKMAVFDLPWVLMITAGLFFLGVAITLFICVMFLSWEDGFGMLGGVLCLIGVLVAAITRHNLNPHTRLFLAVTMGETRRGYLLIDSLFLAGETLLMCFVAWCLCHLEILIYSILIPRAQNELNMLLFFKPSYIAAFVVGVLVLNLFWTAMMGRFGIKGFFFTWFPIWLICILTGPAVHAADSGEVSLLGLIGRGMLWVGAACGYVPWQLIAAVPLVVITAGSLLMLRKIPVKL